MRIHRKEPLIQPCRGRKGFQGKRSFKLRSKSEQKGIILQKGETSFAKLRGWRGAWQMLTTAFFIWQIPAERQYRVQSKYSVKVYASGCKVPSLKNRTVTENKKIIHSLTYSVLCLPWFKISIISSPAASIHGWNSTNSCPYSILNVIKDRICVFDAPHFTFEWHCSSCRGWQKGPEYQPFPHPRP